MKRPIRQVSKNDILEKIDSLVLRDVKDMTVSVNNNTNFYIVKFRTSREGIIYCMKRIHIELDEISKLKTKEKDISKEIKELNLYIKKQIKENEELEQKIKTEQQRVKKYDTNLSILKGQKNRMLKLHEQIDQDINFMQSSINIMKSKNEENLKKYFDTLNKKEKLKNETNKFKKERIYLQNDLKNVNKHHEQLRKKMKYFVKNMNDKRTEEQSFFNSLLST